jgi:hypothetical protein
VQRARDLALRSATDEAASKMAASAFRLGHVAVRDKLRVIEDRVVSGFARRFVDVDTRVRNINRGRSFVS